ncbi:Biotin carboxyl carrier protein (AccB) [Fructobacillus cardui]|nr:Biotin carboxyl carrier protein (AccB) [Fructobacillus cardui]
MILMGEMMNNTDINSFVSLLIENNLTHLHFKNKDYEIELSKEPGQQATVSQPTKGVETNASAEQFISSSLVGTFYSAPSPESDKFVQVGDLVTPETVVAIIESMKMMTEISAGVNGRIDAVLVADGDAIEYGQNLFRIVP